MSEQVPFSFYGEFQKLQSQVKDAVYDKSNSHLKSKYASISSIFEAIRGPLYNSGFYLTFDTHVYEVAGTPWLKITGSVAHHADSGIVQSDISYPIALNVNPQQVNAAVTYGKKAVMLQLFAITSTEEQEADDDGEAVSKREDAPINEATAKAVYDKLEQVKGSRDGTTLARGFGKDGIGDLTQEEGERALKALESAAAKQRKANK